MTQSISLINLVNREKPGRLQELLIRLADRLLGLRAMDKLYQQHDMANLNKQDFARKLLEILNVSVQGAESLGRNIPPQGPVVIASNHPFGGIEGVFLSLLISEIRPDLKVLANQGLKIFAELQDYFIFTNPLSENDVKNGPSIRQCLRHLQAQGALLIFPAGRVSYYQADKQRISEHDWNRLVGRLVRQRDRQYVPIFVDGRNSQLFYLLGRIYFRLRMMMLGRELLNKQGQSFHITAGTPVAASRFDSKVSLAETAALCRALSYAQQQSWRMAWPQQQKTTAKPLAEPVPPAVLLEEFAGLPAEQVLLQHKQYSVCYGKQSQLPHTVKEIARLRELVFRQHDEGSGEALDTDYFDQSYTHLFVIRHTDGQIVGAYRMGQTDELLKQGGTKALYLSRMFNFGADFINQTNPCLEMGRSFLVPEFQRSHLGLYLLWRGIGAFVCKYPRYRTLYGTVSLSKLYDPRSVALIQHALVQPTESVCAYHPFAFAVHPEIADFGKHYALKDHLSAMLAGIEPDGKDIPVLLKHYMKLGARFHCLGVDRNFNDTPGLLLSVDLTQAPEKLLRLYLGKAWKQYLGEN